MDLKEGVRRTTRGRWYRNILYPIVAFTDLSKLGAWLSQDGAPAS